jgi:hypothetical protein
MAITESRRLFFVRPCRACKESVCFVTKCSIPKYVGHDLALTKHRHPAVARPVQSAS